MQLVSGLRAPQGSGHIAGDARHATEEACLTLETFPGARRGASPRRGAGASTGASGTPRKRRERSGSSTRRPARSNRFPWARFGAARRDRRTGWRRLGDRWRSERDRQGRKRGDLALSQLPVPASNANLNTAAIDPHGVVWFTGQSGIVGRVDPARHAAGRRGRDHRRAARAGAIRHHGHPDGRCLFRLACRKLPGARSRSMATTSRWSRSIRRRRNRARAAPGPIRSGVHLDQRMERRAGRTLRSGELIPGGSGGYRATRRRHMRSMSTNGTMCGSAISAAMRWSVSILIAKRSCPCRFPIPDQPFVSSSAVPARSGALPRESTSWWWYVAFDSLRDASHWTPSISRPRPINLTAPPSS